MTARGRLLLITAAAMWLAHGCITAPGNIPSLTAAPATSQVLPASPVEPASTSLHTPSPSQLRTPTLSAPQTANQMVELARLDLAQRLQMPLQMIRLEKVYPDEFPMDNLGCPNSSITPRPVPAIVSGEVIVLEGDGVLYVYHARKKALVFCGKLE